MTHSQEGHLYNFLSSQQVHSHPQPLSPTCLPHTQLTGNQAIEFVNDLLAHGAEFIRCADDKMKQKRSELYMAIRYRKKGEPIADELAAFLINKGADTSVIDAMTVAHLKAELHRRQLRPEGSKGKLKEVLLSHILKPPATQPAMIAAIDDNKDEGSQETLTGEEGRGCAEIDNEAIEKKEKGIGKRRASKATTKGTKRIAPEPSSQQESQEITAASSSKKQVIRKAKRRRTSVN